jgi:hypothetical protein
MRNFRTLADFVSRYISAQKIVPFGPLGGCVGQALGGRRKA